MMAGDRVVELSRAAIRRLARATPTQELARRTQEAVDKVGDGPPYTVAIVGTLAARSSLLDLLAGHALFSGRAEPRRVVLTVQRGPTTRWRARWRDGSVEEQNRSSDQRAIPRHLTAEPTTPAPTRSKELAAVPQPVVAEATAKTRRPPWWALWAWILFWLRSWRGDDSTTRRAVSRLPTATESIDNEGGDDHDATTVRRDSQPAPESATTGVRGPRRTAHVIARPASTTAFAETFGELFGDDSVERIFVDLADGTLPDDVILVDVPAPADARVLATTGIDACVLVIDDDREAAITPQLEAVLAIVPHVVVVGPRCELDDARLRWIGTIDTVPSRLGRIAEIERQLEVSRRVGDALAAGAEVLQRALDDAEAGFRARIDRLEARRIVDVDGYVAGELARLRPAIVEHAHRSLRRAATNVEADLAALSETWTSELRAVTSTDGLRTAAAKLDATSVTALAGVRATRLRKLLDDLTEYTLAQYLELVSALREGTSRTDPLPDVLGIEVGFGEIGGGTQLGTVAPRLTSLFRSLDALKTATLEQLERRIAEIRQHASALFLDGEPRLEPAVTAALGIAWHADAERHGVWLEQALVTEQGVIATERSHLAPVEMALEAARCDGDDLRAAREELLAQLPESRHVPS